MNKLSYHFGHALLDGPLWDRGIREPDTVTILHTLLHRLEMDTRVLTLISSFLDCLGYTVNNLVEEAGGAPRGFQVHEATHGDALQSRDISRESDRAHA